MESETPEASEFTVQDEKELGLQINNYLLAGQTSYPLLERQEFTEIYAYLDQRIDFLEGNPLIQRSTFEWSVNILEDPDNISAFSLPGGHIYLTRGLLDSLSSDSQLLGIMAFQMVLSDQGIALSRLEDAYGFGLLLDVALGSNTDIIDELVNILAAEPIARDQVELAEDLSMDILCPTEFTANGLIQLLEKFRMSNNAQTDWERIYPGNGERINRLTQRLDTLDCQGNVDGATSYFEFLELLP